MFLTEDRIHSSKRQADKMGKSCEAFLREFFTELLDTRTGST